MTKTYEILNNRHQRYGPLFETRKQAQEWLDKKITSSMARIQFYIQIKGDTGSCLSTGSWEPDLQQYLT